ADKKGGDDKKSADAGTVVVDEEGIADRIESLPVAPGFYGYLQPVADGIYYFSGSRTRMRGVRYFSLKDKKENEIGDFSAFLISSNRKKALLKKGNDWFLEDL